MKQDTFVNKNQITLNELPVGARIILRSKTDWRFAAISRFSEENVVLSVSSASGRNYRIVRKKHAFLIMENKIPVMVSDFAENWRENFSKYDCRW